MFYEPAKGHGLPHDPLKAIVAPRPIGWISTRGRDGHLNLAPYSYFNMISQRPPLIWFSSDGEKDSYKAAKETGEFVANLVGQHIAKEMNATSVDAPTGVSEFGYAGLTPAESHLVAAPRVAEAHAALECKVTELFRPKGLDGRPSGNFVCIGEIVGVHIDEAVLTEGRFDAVKAGNVARLGYLDFTTVTELFPMRRPKWDAD
jgi:flavin reductase (DIM6/NTAB) family NADH-FMN oxidoreductase RutF